MLLTGKSFVEEDDKVSVSFFQKLLEKQMKGLKLEGVHPTDPCQKLLLKYDQPAKNEEPLKNERKYKFKNNCCSMSILYFMLKLVYNLKKIT